MIGLLVHMWATLALILTHEQLGIGWTAASLLTFTVFMLLAISNEIIGTLALWIAQTIIRKTTMFTNTRFRLTHRQKNIGEYQPQRLENFEPRERTP